MPVVHFGGPWQMALLLEHALPLGDKPGDLMAMVGTPGRGAGSFASINYFGLISDGVHPVADIEFPDGTRRREVLKHRC